MVRRLFLLSALLVLVFNYCLSFFYPPIWWSMVVFGPLMLIGFIDMFQTQRAICRNFPIIGHLRYLMEFVRPEINQYFVESNSSGRPFSREERSVIYQRAKNVRDTIPFGTQKDLYQTGYEWVNHSMLPKQVDPLKMRVTVGGSECKHPYEASILNIGAMSYGSLSKNAVMAFNEGAKIGHFAHNTGEGGLSPYHLQGGGDLIWQIGTGYFSCRQKDGSFCPEQFKEKSRMPNVKMIELKLSQGAKPGGGGILPGAKVTQDIADVRGVAVGKTIISPPAHPGCDTPVKLLEFIARLRDLSDGKPVGFKLCIGKRHEFLALCKAMIKTGIRPDFIAVDGGEGGTGAAPLEFSNHIGYPLTEGLIYVKNALVGFSLRDKIKIFASGRVTTGFGMVHHMALGADVIYSARGMMLALGCIQALKCDSNHCPVGITTHDPGLTVGLVVSEKRHRIANYHRNTVKSLSQIIGVMGLDHPSQLRPWHIMHRLDTIRATHFGHIYNFLKDGDLLKETPPVDFEEAFKAASPDTFQRVR